MHRHTGKDTQPDILRDRKTDRQTQTDRHGKVFQNSLLKMNAVTTWNSFHSQTD